MSSFFEIKLDIFGRKADVGGMKRRENTRSSTRDAARRIRRRIEGGGERLWRFEDFRGLPFTAVAQALSRLTRRGMLQRLSKGVYYRPRETAFGKSRPNPSALENLARKRKGVFPAGIAAANLLRFTTQTGRRGELSTNSTSLPRKLIGDEAQVHTLRPAAWRRLAPRDAALLEFLREGGRHSELGPDATIRRLRGLMSEGGRWERLLRVAGTEPPRVRAMLGALGAELGHDSAKLERLRRTLNPLSKFDFGALSGLRHAREWQAKNRDEHEAQ
jgi:hypothetical protein